MDIPMATCLWILAPNFKQNVSQMLWNKFAIILKMTLRFEGINFNLQNFCQHLHLEGKTLVLDVNKLFVFGSVLSRPSSKQNLIFSLFSLDGHKISIFFKIAVWQSDSMKWNYGGFTLKTKNYYQKDAGEFYWVFISRIYTLWIMLQTQIMHRLSFFFFFFFRGDHIVPNFEEIWPSKKGKNSAPKRGLEYYYDAMTNGPELSGDFTNSQNFCCL